MTDAQKCGTSRNTRFQAARYGLTWAGLAPADRASFAWRLPSSDRPPYVRGSLLLARVIESDLKLTLGVLLNTA